MCPDYFHDVTDCYWIMPDGGLYSSARDGFCTVEDPLYQKWLQGGGVPAPCPKNAEGQATWLELMNTLKPCRIGRYNQIHAELDRLDLASVRPLRAIDNGTDIPADHQRLLDLENQAAGHRAEAKALEVANG